MGFDSKHEFTPPTILPGLLLCPWMWGITLQLLQCLPSYWGFSDLGRGVPPLGRRPLQCCTAAASRWNVRSMKQGKLEVVKREMARVNVDILGISELKWTGMGEFNSDDRYIYYGGQESLRRNRVAITVSKTV